MFYNDLRYNSYSQYLKDEFGCKVYKVTLDAGFTCPNRDGTLSSSGCIFCDDSGSYSRAQDRLWTIKKQLVIGKEKLKTRFKAQKFIAYFQAYSNTYGSVEHLKSVYDQIIGVEDVVGMSVATRSDCIDKEKLELIESFTNQYYTWIEYGLQTIHNKTLKLINRGHLVDSFYESYDLTRKYSPNVRVCAHVILGLPGESRSDIVKTAKKLSQLMVDGVKIHLLCVLQGTNLQTIYNNGDFIPLDQQEYVEIVCDFLEHLAPSITIHRMAGNGLKKILVAPSWLSKKMELLNQIQLELTRRNSYQGKSLQNFTS